MTFHPHLLQGIDPELLDRVVSAAGRALEAPASDSGELSIGVTAEQLLQNAGLPEREQIRYMGLALDRIRHERGEAPDDSTRTMCHWCRRTFETSTGRGIHERDCQGKLARNRRIVHAYLVEGLPGTVIAKAEGMSWSVVYRVLRQEGVRPGAREGAA